jgi:hypothetical protein
MTRNAGRSVSLYSLAICLQHTEHSVRMYLKEKDLHLLAICLQYREQSVCEYVPVGEGPALVSHLSVIQGAVCQ